MAAEKSVLLGRWRIYEMEQWDCDYIDLDVPGFIEFVKNELGSFQFGTVEGGLDCRFETANEGLRVEFSWEGMSVNDPGCGRGWAVMQGTELYGRLFIHLGDDSWFKAKRM